MAKGRIKKVVGKISDEVVERYGLYEYRNMEIIQSFDLYQHIQKHVYEFESIDSYNHTISNIPQIILNPLFVYYDSERNSLLYFKKIDENVCVVVKLNLRKNKDTYISTIYPLSESKIQRYKELSYIKKGSSLWNKYEEYISLFIC